MTSATQPTVFDELEARGLIAQSTGPTVRQRLTGEGEAVGGLTVYNGFDPTADSLHLGHLVPMIGLAHLARAGHRPVALVGGATALVGDPSGKTQTRQMLSREQIEGNAAAIEAQIRQVVGENLVMVNNADWLAEKGWIELLREVGPHFGVNRMLRMESVRGRIDSDQGISFLEFNYMVMQAYDYLHLYREMGCTLQTGGQDQWGNIVMGIELIRRVEGVHETDALDEEEPSSKARRWPPSPGSALHCPAGLTFPLVTRADGGKFGKTEAGTVWLDPHRTSPYDFYQFFRNTADRDVPKYLGYFTFLPLDEIRRLSALTGSAINEAKEVLAYEVTRLVHGQSEADSARDSARRAFSSQTDVHGEAIPHTTIPAAELDEGVGLLGLLVRAELANSNSEARRLVQGGGVRIGEMKIDDPKRTVTRDDIDDDCFVLRVGKKKIFRYDVA